MSNKMREEFEGWAGENGYDYLHRGSVSGDYIGGATAVAWQAWQASRAALCVELPEAWRSVGSTHELMHKQQTIEAIHSAGVKTK